MPINFPPTPAVNDVYTFGSRSWVWNGITWKAQRNIFTVAGENTQIQYNNGGVLGASSNLTYNLSTNTLALSGTDPTIDFVDVSTDPAASLADNLTIYSKSLAGKSVFKTIDEYGNATPLQSSLFQNKVGIWTPPGNATTTPGVFGFNAPTALGTATVRTPAATNVFTRAQRLGYNSSGTAGNSGGHYQTLANYTIGTGTLGVGGFFYVCRFGAADAVTQAITFVGLSSSVASPSATTSPATFTNAIGIGAATGDTNLSIYYGGSAAQTPIALGTSFPKSTNSTDYYELVLFSPSTLNDSVGYKVTNISSGAVATGTLTGTAGTAIPASTTFLAHRAYRSNNATASAVLIDINSVYIETEN